jgi:endogenous inhibitor of DNA gyrase (YacG/DUF329 family)
MARTQHAEAICAHCGGAYAQKLKKKGRRFCSASCRKKAWLVEHASAFTISKLRKDIEQIKKRLDALEEK